MTSEERDREGLSALMDGEAQELELRRTLEAIAGDTSLRERWQRQHRVRDALHGQLAGQANIDVSKGVQPLCVNNLNPKASKKSLRLGG